MSFDTLADQNKYMKKSLESLFPPLCAFCKKVILECPQFPGICRHCLTQLPFRPYFQSRFNWQIFSDACLPDSWVYCPTYYQGMMRQALPRLKFGDAPDLAPALASLMLHSIGRHHLKFRSVVAVPLHPARFRERGYNQSGLLARQIAMKMDIPDWSFLIERTRKTGRQSEQTERSERWINIAGAFNLSQNWQDMHIKGISASECLPVLLIDDILTTGATLSEAAKQFWQVGIPVTGMVVSSDHQI